MKTLTRHNRRIKKTNKRSKRRKGGMKTKKTRSVTFGDPLVIEFDRISSDVEDNMDDYPECPSFKHIRGHHFPCRYKNTIFENQKEFGDWYLEELKKTISRKGEKDKHKKRIKSEQLYDTGNWNRYMAPEFRNYTSEGLVEDVFPFGELSQEDSENLLREKRRERLLSQREWMEDVRNFRRTSAKGDDIGAKTPGTI